MARITVCACVTLDWALGRVGKGSSLYREHLGTVEPELGLHCIIRSD